MERTSTPTRPGSARRTRRWLAPALLTAGLILPASLGHAAPRAGASPVTIEVWDHNSFGDLATHLDTLMKAFERTHPLIRLKLVHNQTPDKDLTAIAAGGGPDVVWLWDGSSPVANWAANGVIQPLDSFISASHYNLSNLQQAGVGQVTYRGHTWGLPLLGDTFWLWYNVKDFRAAGLDPAHPPATLQETLADGIKLTRRSGSGRILRLGYLPGFYSAANGGSGASVAYINGNDVNPYSPVFGASLYSADSTKVTPDSPANLAVWNEMRTEAGIYDRLYGHDRVIRFISGLGAPFTAQEGFLSGRVSMKIDGDWVPQNVRDYKPSWKYGVDYAVAPVPYAAGYARFAHHQAIATYPLVMSSRTKHPQEAWEFMRWLQDPAQGADMGVYLYNLPLHKAALDSPRLTALPGFSALLPLMRSQITLVADPIAPVGDQYNSVVNSYTNAILSGQTSPAAAMGAVRQRMQSQLDKIVATGH